MLSVTNPSDERLTSARRAKLAYIYVRQSTVTQIKHHQESTELQYRLVDRAEDLGWPRERIQVLDEDLGKSGAGTTERQGFQKLISEISLGHAGLVMSLDASRLARNNRDWHQLLELCSLFGVLLLLRDNQNPVRCDNQSCQAHCGVCYVGVHRSSRMLAAKIRVKPDLRPPPSAATGLDADFGCERPMQSWLACLIVAEAGSLIVAQHLADGERLFDPCAYHDRLLLGLSGIMSEAELHQIRLRLHQGERQKAARGELRLPVPAGLVHDRSGAVTFNPDEEVQARVALVFAKFRELHSAHAVRRYLRANGLPLPVRPLRGPAPHDVVWREATSACVRSILQNPALAGAYVYGRRRQAPGQARAGSCRPSTIKVPVAEWEVCLQESHPGYISWEEFMANQRRLADNVNRYDADHVGVPRKGAALLQGIAMCGRCGRRMSLRYTGPQGDYPVYCCRADRDQTGAPLCQEVRALAVDARVEAILLEALKPDQIAIALAALGQLDREARQLERQWGLRRERARYEAERAQRQYDAVEPENRLVARSLERAWEEKLRAVEAVDQEHDR